MLWYRKFLFHGQGGQQEAQQFPGLDKTQALQCIPVRHPSITAQRREDGCYRLTFPVEFRPWFVRATRWLGLADRDLHLRRLDLDILGTAVWDLIDSSRSVAAIARYISREYGLLSREAELSVAAFFKQLGQRGLVIMRVPEDEAGTLPTE